MKKIFSFAMAVIALTACQTNTKTTTTEADGDTTSTVTTTTTTSDNTAYAPAEGDVTRRDGKVMVMRNGVWVEADKEVTLDNDVVVYKNGKVKKQDREIELEDGEVVTKTGDFFDRTGHAIENAWDKTKEGVKDAGKAVGVAAEKLGNKAKDAVDDDDKH